MRKDCGVGSDDFILDSRKFCESLINKPNCVVYSAGIQNRFAWEEKMRNLGCEVHAFDPTTKHISSPNLTFHNFGFESSGSNSVVYDEFDKSQSKSLKEVMRMLGHTKLSIVNLDCEGCEWMALKEVCDYDLKVDQLLVEFHFPKHMGIETLDDMKTAAETIQCMEKNGWLTTFFHKGGLSRKDLVFLEEIYRASVTDIERFSGTVSLSFWKENVENRMWMRMKENVVRARKNCFDKVYGDSWC